MRISFESKKVRWELWQLTRNRLKIRLALPHVQAAQKKRNLYAPDAVTVEAYPPGAVLVCVAVDVTVEVVVEVAADGLEPNEAVNGIGAVLAAPL